MKYATIIILGAFVLLGLGVYLGQQFQQRRTYEASADQAPTANNAATSSGGPVLATGAATAKKNRGNAWAKLAEKYGDGRTKLSKKVTEDMSSLLTDAMEIADMHAQLSGATDAKGLAAESAMRAISRRLGLTPDQVEKAKPIIAARVEERMLAVQSLSEAMNDDPEMMMETILAGDALSRNLINQEEYDAIAEDTLAVLRNVGGFALGGRGSNDLADPLLVEQINEILTPEQQQTLAKLAQDANTAAAANDGQMLFQNGNLPAMELEKLESAMVNAKKLTTGIRGVIEGFQGIQQALPKNEGEK